MLKLSQACSQIVEHRNAALAQGVSIERRLDPVRSTVEQPNTERRFQGCHCFRHDWLRNREMLGGLRHATPLGDREENFQLAQLESPAQKLCRTHSTSYSNHLYP